MKHTTRMTNWQVVCKTLSWPVASRSLFVVLVVGTVLNAINQGPEIVNGKPINLLRLTLAYAVPFFVASYGAYSAFRQMDPLHERQV